MQARNNARRANLQNQMMAAKNRQQEVLANLAELKAQKADAAEDLKSQRTELEELSAEYEMIEIATALLPQNHLRSHSDTSLRTDPCQL